MKQRIRNYEIESIDDDNYTVSRVSVAQKGKHEGEETLVNIGYFNTLESAVRRVASLCANALPDLRKWVQEYKAVIAEVKAVLGGDIK